MLTKPLLDQIPSFQRIYIEKCPENIRPFLQTQKDDFLEIIKNLTEQQLSYRYAENKWTLSEVLMHINDTEQIFAYRALAIHRGERQVLPGFDQDEYMDTVDFSHISNVHFFKLFQSIRTTSNLLFDSIKDNEWSRKGLISDYSMSLSTMPYMIGGHLEHHKNIIKERYLS